MRFPLRVVGDYHVDRQEVYAQQCVQLTCTNGPKSFRSPDYLSQVIYCGGYSGGVPPLPIPNREVKPASADGTDLPVGRVSSCRSSRGSMTEVIGPLFFTPAAAQPPPGAIRFSEILFIFEDIYSHTMERKLIWSEAGIPGLILGLATAVCFYLTSLLGNALLNGIVWVAKLAGCICLMYFFMKKFVSIHSGADNRDSFRFGVIVALLSAFIYSVSFYIFTVYIKPDMFDAALSAVMDNYSSILDSNSLEQIENLIPKLPAIGFFSNLIYCFLYGTIVSAIISRSVPSTNPFDNDTPDEQ